MTSCAEVSESAVLTDSSVWAVSALSVAAVISSSVAAISGSADCSADSGATGASVFACSGEPVSVGPVAC